jgi:hypothetical protein
MIGITTSRLIGRNVSKLDRLRIKAKSMSHSDTLPAGEETELVIGNALTDLQVIITYVAIRDHLGQSGKITVECPYIDVVVNPPVWENDYDEIGITDIAVSIVDGKITLTFTVDDSMEKNVEFYYNVEIIKGIEKTVQP